MYLPLTLLAVTVLGVCQAATFDAVGGSQDCSPPTWRCDCKLVYHCDDDDRYPDLAEAEDSTAGYFKDLAPIDYPLEIPGKRWRKSKYTSEAFCKRECEDRMNAFLCLDEVTGDFSDYSYSAVCLKLLNHPGGGPFNQDGSAEPCCTIYLEYGPQWCTKKWHRAVGTARCLTLSTVDFSSVTSEVTNVFSVEGGCEASDGDGGSFTWCSEAPTCTATAA